MTTELLRKIQRGIRKPPKVILKRLGQEVVDYSERYLAPKRARELDLANLLKKTKQPSLNHLWRSLSERVYCTQIGFIDKLLFEKLCPQETSTILMRACHALEHQVDLLGSGLIPLGVDIDWHKDYKTQQTWPLNYMRDIDYNNPDRPSDVKFPWEVSRLHWLIPVGQAYLLTQDESYANATKNILLSWIDKNPYAYGINWACTMEVALRILSWSWLFHVFKHSQAWQDELFQQRFLTSFYLHGDFTERHLEYSDINGNHYTADAAGLVFAGLFFGQGDAPNRWQRLGWDILNDEFPRQVFDDGVDFEASVPYHRLVLELFLLPAIYRQVQGLEVNKAYQDRLGLMAKFSVAYTQPTGAVPFLGDADDARALPFGNQAINDHRYLAPIVGHVIKDLELLENQDGSLGEFFWFFGPDTLQDVLSKKNSNLPKSSAFPEGGFYVMRNQHDHIFIDCGTIGQKGRGGHGHNDCLSFEAVLNGVKLITDSGAYVYTASYMDRNLFRSSAYHNTPLIDNEEINRFIRPDYLWTMHNDALPQVEQWKTCSEYDLFVGSHTGYLRLSDPVIPKRTLLLDHAKHSLMIQDDILCEHSHEVMIPLHLAVGVKALAQPELRLKSVLLKVENKEFLLCWEGTADWSLEVLPSRISPSYGVIIPGQKLVWRANIKCNGQLKVVIMPNC